MLAAPVARCTRRLGLLPLVPAAACHGCLLLVLPAGLAPALQPAACMSARQQAGLLLAAARARQCVLQVRDWPEQAPMS